MKFKNKMYGREFGINVKGFHQISSDRHKILRHNGILMSSEADVKKIILSYCELFYQNLILDYFFYYSDNQEAQILYLLSTPPLTVYAYK